MIRRAREQRRERLSGRESTFQEINITPFTDVLLVLLIIFLIAGSTLAPNGMRVEGLSPEGGISSSEGSEATVTVWVSPQGSLTIKQGQHGMVWADLTQRQDIVLRAHPEAPTGVVMKVYDQLLVGGFARARLGSALELQ